METGTSSLSTSAPSGTIPEKKKSRGWVKVVVIIGVIGAVVCVAAIVTIFLLGRSIETAKNTWIRSMAWSPDGSRIAVGAGDNVITIWEVASGNLATTISAHKGWVRSLAWSPDGKILASGGGDGSVFLWEPLSGRPMGQPANDTSGLGYLAWSPDGSRLAYVGASGTVMFWDPESGVRTTFGSTKDIVTGISWAHDGTRLAVSASNGSVYVLDATTGAQVWSAADVQGGLGWANAVDWSPDDTRVAAGGDDSVVRVWDGQTGQKVTEIKGEVPIFAVAWSPELPLRLVWSSKQDEVTVSDLKGPGLLLHGAIGNAYSFAWSPDGRQLAVGTERGSVLIWDPASGSLVKSLVIPMH